jgi:LysM repeat protein/uncharacterized protein YvpB
MTERATMIDADDAVPQDGLTGLYAQRALDRGVDPRVLAAASRVQRGGLDRGLAARAQPLAAARAIPVAAFGRGTPEHRAAPVATPPSFRAVSSPDGRFGRAPRFGLDWLNEALTPRPARRLAAAGLAALAALPLAVLLAGAEPASFQARYIVQPGDTLWGVAESFGVEPDAILAASYVQAAPELTPGETIVIPVPGQPIDEAVAQAAAQRGMSPFAAGAHLVQPGETLGQIAADRGLDAPDLALFNGLPDIDALNPGDRLLLPPIMDWPGGVNPNLPSALPGAGLGLGGERSSMDYDESESITEPTVSAPDGTDVALDGAPIPGAPMPGGPVMVEGVPVFMQRYGLSCEYAATSIATAAFGAPIDEDVFRANIGPSENPHWGFRGWIDGAWGGTDDYGIYPEALAPTLQANGFIADVFYAGGDASALTARLDDGMPVVTWLGFRGEPGMTMDDAGTYTLVPGMHAVTVYGYDDWGVYVADPGSGAYDYHDWDSFMGMWAALDGMAMGVAPVR